ncbi:hypothetical protein CBS101457_004010 [Exobasidium rhododendri]|nr:hypothetical protein CBS101457_004010 [Exobasidium rhododendri]
MSTYAGPNGPRPNDAKTGEKGKPMAPIPSASLIVLCPVSGGSNEAKGQKYATLMVQRSARDGSSFRSAVVFPGGALDLADEDAIQKMAQGDLSPCTSSVEEDSTVDAAYSHSLRLCALRETFEETGLLLVPAEDTQGAKSRAIGPSEAGIQPIEWARLREEIHNDARAFPSFLRRIVRTVSPHTLGDESDLENFLPSLAPMTHHSNWVTPKMVVRPAKRFDAHFYLTILEKADSLGPLTSDLQAQKSTNDLLNLSADGTETLSLSLATPSELVESAVRDEIVLFPPQFYILADLAATLRNRQSSTTSSFPPLVFLHPTERQSHSEEAEEVTTVEEEPRGLHPDSPYQFEKQTDSSLHQGTKSVTSVEPEALPRRGSTVKQTNLPTRNGGRQQHINSPNVPAKEQDDPFVFPLVLPGDFLASEEQQSKLSGRKVDNDRSVEKPLNRLYVTPRSKEDGGGLIVRGARRRGLPGLVDLAEGSQLEEEMDATTKHDEHGGSKSRL